MKNVEFNKTRTVWVDNVRMFAMVCVMLGHTWRLIDCPLPLWLSDFILAFNMPLFVLLSGFVAVKSLKRIDTWTDFIDYVYKIAMRIMIPAVIFSSTINALLHLAKFDFKHMAMHGMIVAVLLLL